MSLNQSLLSCLVAACLREEEIRADFFPQLISSLVLAQDRGQRDDTGPSVLTDRREKPGELVMGGSSSKKTFPWQRKKKSPLNKAWSSLKGALPSKKRKKKKKKGVLEKLNLDNLRKDKHSQKRFSLPTDKKEPISQKRFSLGNIRKESIQKTSPGGKEDGGGLGWGEQMEKLRKGSVFDKSFSLPPSRKNCKKMRSID
ncbi:hypothetical protein E3U43_008606 [Xyrichtys novacula]|uniref:Uncharacterized protein n=1 Tax=Xyrichtys novacula TaxID=13765 RepID=A0AAV1EZ32_XYRNO|nr:hypothetical protein E3U43_008606 [Xyrichtys novacula]